MSHYSANGTEDKLITRWPLVIGRKPGELLYFAMVHMNKSIAHDTRTVHCSLWPCLYGRNATVLRIILFHMLAIAL